MNRRPTKLAPERARTFWLAWLAWGVMGTLFFWEDSRGGTGWLTLLLTSPFWLLFAVWPLLWAWRRFARSASQVDLDEDIPSESGTARLVVKDGRRFADAQQMRELFGAIGPWPLESISGGPEAFVDLRCLETVRAGNPKLAGWLDAVGEIGN